jgi:hypothetical protein
MIGMFVIIILFTLYSVAYRLGRHDGIKKERKKKFYEK